MKSHAHNAVPDNLVAQYDRLGYFLPFEVLSPAQARVLRDDLESAEHALHEQPQRLTSLQQYPHLLLPQFDALVRDPRLLAGVSQILGPDLLVWACGLFIKEARSASMVSWHQDLNYWGLNALDEVTAWVALSPSTENSGAMRFIPGTHRTDAVEHVDTFDDDNLLTRGQTIAVSVDESRAVSVLLAPGQASLHHGRLFHSSGPNRSGDRRIGVAIRYIKPSMRQSDGVKPMARQVLGQDNCGNFTLVTGPSARLAPADFERCDADRVLRDQVLFKGAAR